MKISEQYGKIIVDGECSVRDALLAVASRYLEKVEVQQRVAAVSPKDAASAKWKAQDALRRGNLYMAASKTAKGGTVNHRETLTTVERPQIGD